MSDVKRHTFNVAVDTVLAECIAISDARGSEYSDTWAIEYVQTSFLDRTLEIKPDINVPLAGSDLMQHWRRLLAMAGLIDVKISRLRGPWKRDTLVDAINYLATYTHLREIFEAEKKKHVAFAEAAKVNAAEAEKMLPTHARCPNCDVRLSAGSEELLCYRCTAEAVGAKAG